MEPRGRCHMRMDAETVIREANPVKLIMFINQIHRRKIEKLLDGTGLHRAQHRMLMTLSDCPVTSQVELANILEVSAATVAVSLKKLEKGGYIQKTQQEQDSRVRFVELTEKGRSVVEESKEIRWMQNFWKDLTKSSWRCFKAYWGRCTAMRRI